jgi:flagellar basal-body rod modification protein FlgD
MTTTGVSGSQDAASSVSTKTTAPVDKLADKSTFLKLLVAQLKYQNPLNPADGVQFVTQLAQFSALEQSTSMSQDLAAIRADLEKQGSATPTTTTTA